MSLFFPTKRRKAEEIKKPSFLYMDKEAFLDMNSCYLKTTLI